MTDGSDLIFAIGAPGSKWSRVLTILGFHPDINSSDYNKFPVYGSKVKFNSGKTKKVGVHTGAYFGPGNNVGEKFYELDKLTKEEFIEEIKPCFDNWESGIKIIKSHWFAYNIDWLVDNFPAAKIILVYNGNNEAFKWWHLVGGWNITFPNYSWYENDTKMWKQIQIENSLILNFMRKKKITFNVSELETLVEKLGLPLNEEFLSKITIQKDDDRVESIVFKTHVGSAVAVYDPTDISAADIDKDIVDIDQYIAKKHIDLSVDELLINRYNNKWLNNLEDIISKGNI
jgi:hypothetical protein